MKIIILLIIIVLIILGCAPKKTKYCYRVYNDGYVVSFVSSRNDIEMYYGNSKIDSVEIVEIGWGEPCYELDSQIIEGVSK